MMPREIDVGMTIILSFNTLLQLGEMAASESVPTVSNGFPAQNLSKFQQLVKAVESL